MDYNWFTTTFDDLNTSSVSMTELDKALLSSALSFLYNRNVWDDMTDATWDDLQAKIADIEVLLDDN